jgi:hypothetical protein
MRNRYSVASSALSRALSGASAYGAAWWSWWLSWAVALIATPPGKYPLGVSSEEKLTRDAGDRNVTHAIPGYGT